MGFVVQHTHEDFLHFSNDLHHLSHAKETTILYCKFSLLKTYDPKVDDFPHYKVIYPGVALITLVINTEFEIIELLWSYSLWLEAVAFIPQIIILNKIKTVENVTSHYVASLGAYRFFYLLSWMYRWLGGGTLCWTQILSGLL